jgi:hypothetical protein
MTKPSCGNRRDAKFDATVAQLKAGMDRALAGEKIDAPSREATNQGTDDEAVGTLVLPEAMAVARKDGRGRPQQREGTRRSGDPSRKWLIWTVVIAAATTLLVAAEW